MMSNSKHFPDFIIGGAMKSGTSTLHHVLRQHEDIFIPNGEIAYFSLDDVRQHPDFFPRRDGEWVNHDFHDPRYRQWYESHFDDANDYRVVGEDSTAYLASTKAPPRIAELLPDVDLLFILRDPVERTYSHYWHEVRVGRAERTFEDMIQFDQGTLLQRSFYKQHIHRFRSWFPEDQIHVFLFEEFIGSMNTVVDRICDVLGVSSNLDLGSIETHRHPSVYPRFPGIQLRLNRWLREYTAHRRYHSLPGMPDPKRSALLDFIRNRVCDFNLSNREKPPMDSDTRSFLQSVFQRENQGLGEIIDPEPSDYWDWFDDGEDSTANG